MHTGYPIRHWDSDLGPAQPHLLGVDLAGEGAGEHDFFEARCAT